MNDKMGNERTGDLVLSQGTYALIQDGASGNVEVIVGPSKVSLAESDKPVIYDPRSRTFIPTDKRQAIKTWPTATEGQYLVLTNPVKDDTNQHPGKGKQQARDLSIGNKINLPGPVSFGLFPGQDAEVIEGHQLKSNEYLLVRVYNEEEAKANFKNAIVKTIEEGAEKEKKKSKKHLFTEEDLFTGNLLIIKGTDVSFYIPPTGIEVVPNDGSFVRDAVTLERLEYCILLDQNGDKRYVQGPAVVFPKPTETFIDTKGNTKFQSIELNDNMGIYIKVIADYSENGKDYKAGDEIFITGNEQKIYFPRPEHAMIKYGKRWIHYSVAIPEGEGRYVLDKNEGNVKMVTGPKMFLADPRDEVIVKRVLDMDTCQLWYPGNEEALRYNLKLAGKQDEMLGYATDEHSTMKSMASSKSRSSAYTVGEELYRSTNFTKPRSIQLDTKYDGVVTINVWPGYAIQVVKKTGERSVIKGPQVKLLGFNETLEPLALSTGKPKKDHDLFKTAYLQVENNIVSDIVKAETKDMVSVDIRISYRVNFLEEYKDKWFNVSDYVKLLTQHIRSVIRGKVSKLTIQEFSENSTDVVRDLVLGTVDKKTNTRPGKTFEENGMKIYDAEVLYIKIGDHEIESLLRDSERETVRHNLEILEGKKDLEHTKAMEEISREEINERAKTDELRRKMKKVQIEGDKELQTSELDKETSKQDALDVIKQRRVARDKMESDELLAVETAKANLEIKVAKEKLAAVSPKLAEALTTMGNQHVMEVLARNLKAQNGNLAGIFNKGGIEGLLESVKGTPIEAEFIEFFKNINKKSKK